SGTNIVLTYLHKTYEYHLELVSIIIAAYHHKIYPINNNVIAMAFEEMYV
ncbi:8338_t:CDS:1, partial [Entrophospora sp. SA101]